MKKLFIIFFLAANLIMAQRMSIIAHRGGALLAPENTIAAYQNAVNLGSDYFELDVRLSKDDSLMIMHDDTIDRTTSGSGALSSFIYLQLRLYDAGSWFGPEFAGQKIPTLYEALSVAKGTSTKVVIELKSSETRLAGKVVDLVKAMNMEDRVLISCFNLNQIAQVRTLDPSIEIQQFVNSVSQSEINDLKAINAEWIGSGSEVSPALRDSVHAAGMLLNIWTIDNPVKMVQYNSEGYDGITTNDPVTAMAVLDTTAPSTVVLNQPKINITKVRLTWEPSTDNEGEITGYEIYRDETPNATTLLATVTDGTFYLDNTKKEEATFYYRVRAKNVAGLYSDYSNEVMAVTAKDDVPPMVSEITSFGTPGKLVVKFNESVEAASAENTVNYNIDNGITVSSAKISLDSQSVILTVSDLSENTNYLLAVSGVKDQAINPNAIVDTIKKTFTHTNFLSNTIGAWDCDEGENTTLGDLSGNNNNATLMNGLGWGEGRTANGLSFDGVDDYAEVPTSASLDIGGDQVSISIWAKLDLLPTELPGAFGPMYDSETDNYVIYEDKGNNELRFKVTTSDGAARPGIPTSALVANKWIHIVGVYDGTNAMIYLNGVFIKSLPLTGTVNAGQVATIGKSGSTYFKGALDNIQVFNKALTQDEINLLYTGFYTSYLDLEPPQLLGVSSLGAPSKLYLTFNEPLDDATAKEQKTMLIDNSVTVNNAQLTVDGKSVILTTSGLSENTIVYSYN